MCRAPCEQSKFIFHSPAALFTVIPTLSPSLVPVSNRALRFFFLPPPIPTFCQSLSLVFTALSQSPQPIPSFPCRSVSERLGTFSRPLIVVFLLPFFFTVSTSTPLPDCELERSIVGVLIHKTSARGVARLDKKERAAMYMRAVSVGERIWGEVMLEGGKKSKRRWGRMKMERIITEKCVFAHGCVWQEATESGDGTGWRALCVQMCFHEGEINGILLLSREKKKSSADLSVSTWAGPISSVHRPRVIANNLSRIAEEVILECEDGWPLAAEIGMRISFSVKQKEYLDSQRVEHRYFLPLGFWLPPPAATSRHER